MKHAILLLWHKDIEQLKNLIKLFDEDFKFYIHIDKKSIITKEEIGRLKNNQQIAEVYQKYRINWGGFNILKAELLLLQEIVRDNSIGYIHFMSGQDYPIKKLDGIKSFFSKNNGKEFMEYIKLPVKKWEHGTYDRFVYYRLNDWFDYNTHKGYRIIEKFIAIQKRIGYKRRIPDQFEHLYGGSNWMSITYECAKHITENKRKYRRFYNRLKYTFAADEVYFHTVILNSIFANKVEKNNQRCILWDGKGSPIILNETHWWEIITSNRLFARKLDNKVSAKLIEYINRYLFADNEVITNSQGCWLNENLNGHCYDNKLATGLLRLFSLMEVYSIADFGCGPGWYVALLRKQGYEVEGYDGNPNVEKMSSLLFSDGFHCQYMDFTEESEAEEPFDVVMSLEVGEHIPVQWEDTFIKNLTRNARKYIILSWAAEGQYGDGHINNRPNSYIIELLCRQGFILNRPASVYLREQASLWWFKNTIMVFDRI